MSSRRVRVVWGAGAATAAIVGASVWAGTGPLGAGDCKSQEAEDFPHLEKVAREVAGDVGDRMRRYSFCEDSGMPGAAVQVSVYAWNKHSEAREFLGEAPDVEPRDDSDAFSIEGVRIHSTVTDDHLANDGHRFVMLTFFVPR